METKVFRRGCSDIKEHPFFFHLLNDNKDQVSLSIKSLEHSFMFEKRRAILEGVPYCKGGVWQASRVQIKNKKENRR